jgi:hypothetical protein
VQRDIADWKFIKRIDTTDVDHHYDRRAETGKLFRRLTGVRVELDEALARLKKYPEFVNLDLDDAFSLA